MLRRSLSLLAMTIVLPGSAQVVAGHRRLGLTVLIAWLGAWAAAAFVAVLTLVFGVEGAALLTLPATLRTLQWLLVLISGIWALLLVDAWRIARPLELARRHRPGFALLDLVLVGVVVGALLTAASTVSAQREFVQAVFVGGGDAGAKKGRINVLLLGGDAGDNRVGLRPDSLTVASVSATTGRTVLFSLPRNLQEAPFRPGSPMQQQFPRGFTCKDNSCMLNAVYTYATTNKNLYPKAKDPGAEATMDAVEGVTGLDINYYALVDLKGFEALIDAVGGITIDVNTRVPIGGGTSKIKGYIEPGKDRHLNGYNALWFARSREGSSDYERMTRQKCVMSAMSKQLDPITVLANFKSIAAAGQDTMATNVPASRINELLDLALKARQLPLSSVSFVPPLINPANPNIETVHAKVRSRIAASERADDPTSRASEKPEPTPQTPKHSSGGAESAAPTHRKPTSDTKTATSSGPDVDSLDKVCKA